MTVYLDDPDVTLYHGDALETLRGMPDESVHCVVTSPPYWGLRDYGTGLWEGGDTDCDHHGSKPSRREHAVASSGLEGGKKTIHASIINAEVCHCGAHRVDNQMGLEPTPELYVTNMVTVFREVRRVLRRDGTCWLNIGDSYASVSGSGLQGENGQMATRTIAQVRDSKAAAGMGAPRRPPGVSGLKPKDLCLIPAHLAIALQADGWYVRMDIIWAKPNPMPESVTDRPTKAHEYVFLLTKSPRYFFDQEAVREQLLTDPEALRKRVADAQRSKVLSRTPDDVAKIDRYAATTEPYAPTGRNVRSVWEIATEPFPQAHFATFPTELARRCILAGTSERGCCLECGAPWVREVDVGYDNPGNRTTNGPRSVEARNDPRHGTINSRGSRLEKRTSTLGWRPTCGCPGNDLGGSVGARTSHLIPCTVLDPFAGACTVPLVARRHGRHSIGIELSETYLREIALPRLQQLSLLA